NQSQLWADNKKRFQYWGSERAKSSDWRSRWSPQARLNAWWFTRLLEMFDYLERHSRGDTLTSEDDWRVSNFNLAMRNLTPEDAKSLGYSDLTDAKIKMTKSFNIAEEAIYRFK